MRGWVDWGETAGVEFNILPGAHEALSGNGQLGDMREVGMDYLLGRDPVKLDWHRIKDSLCDKTVLVTGAGGSIGAELCRQLASVCSARLVILDHRGFSLYTSRLNSNLCKRSCLENSSSPFIQRGNFWLAFCTRRAGC